MKNFKRFEGSCMNPSAEMCLQELLRFSRSIRTMQFDMPLVMANYYHKSNYVYRVNVVVVILV